MLFRGVLFLCLCSADVRASFFDWLGGWTDSGGGGGSATTDTGVPLLSVPFEELSPEEKFLVEASKITGLKLSQLDTCQHKLIMKLKSSCASLSEEDLAKLSVNLLNCQSAVEGRKEFPCTENMSLKACTGEMDAETWNAYHVISNRARAVCYASRQQQFRALSEMTVNKLMSTAHSHIAAMSALKDQQENMQSSAVLAVSELNRGTRDVYRVYSAFRLSQALVNQEIENNLKLLRAEKELIADYQNRLNKLATTLQSNLAAAADQLVQQVEGRKLGEDKLLKDIERLSESTTKIRNQIDKSGRMVEELNRISKEEYKAALDNLREINASISYLTKLVEQIRQVADAKYGYVKDVLGTNGEQLDKAIVALVHIAMLLLFMLILSFVQGPRTSRWALLLLAPLNLNFTLNENYQKYSLDIVKLYSIITAIIFVDVTVRWMTECYLKYKRNRRQFRTSMVEKKETFNHSDNTEINESNNKVNDWLRVRGSYVTRDDPIVSSSNGVVPDLGYRPTPLTTTREEDSKSMGSESTIRKRILENGYLISNHHRMSLGGSVSSSRATCLALTKSGNRCKNTVHDGFLYCRHHTANNKY